MSEAIKKAESDSTEAQNEAIKELVEDLFGHQEFSEQMILFLEDVATPGQVVSLRAPWGRGKTDVLKRAYRYAVKRQEAKDSPIACVAFVNPWQYGKADLLSPLLVALVAKIPAEKRRAQKEEIKKVLKGLIGAASGAALKAASLDGIADLAEKLLDGVFKGEAAPGDPLAPLGVAFKELIERYVVAREVLEATGGAKDVKKTRVLIFVDDVDRCLPARQIALLEAFHFLVDAGADATFVMAVDPEILANSAYTHYDTKAFDANRYLDKIFDFNLVLPVLTDSDFRDFAYRVQKELKDATRTRHTNFPQNFGPSLLAALKANHKFRNPRIVTRFLHSLKSFWVRACDFPDAPIEAVLYWMLALQAWPEVRFQLDLAMLRGASNPEGDADNQLVQAISEHLPPKDHEALRPFALKGELPLGDTKFTFPQMIHAYRAVSVALRKRGL